MLGHNNITIYVNDQTLGGVYVNINFVALEVSSGLTCSYQIIIHLIGSDTLNLTSTEIKQKQTLKLDIPCPSEKIAKRWSYSLPLVVYNE